MSYIVIVLIEYYFLRLLACFSLNANIQDILGFKGVYATFLRLNTVFSDNIAKFA